MYIQKLTALALSVIMTVGLVAASAPPVTVERGKPNTGLESVINDCRQGFIAWRFGGDKEQLVIKTLIEGYEPQDRKAIVIICKTYAEGYADGERGVN